jgi:hypothetical protein
VAKNYLLSNRERAMVAGGRVTCGSSERAGVRGKSELKYEIKPVNA